LLQSRGHSLHNWRSPLVVREIIAWRPHV